MSPTLWVKNRGDTLLSIDLSTPEALHLIPHPGDSDREEELA